MSGLHAWGVYRLDYGRRLSIFSFGRARYKLVSSHKTQDAAARCASKDDQIHRTAHKGRGWTVRNV